MVVKPKSIFLDADSIIALNAHKHTNYSKALKITQKIKELQLDIFTCTYVLLESATVLNMRFPVKRGAQVVTKIMSDSNIKIIRGDDYLADGIRILSTQKSKNISLNDCVYFAIVDELKIDCVFSFDKHWQKNEVLKDGKYLL